MEEILLGKYNFYKANLHAHTTSSDGCLTAAQMVKAYKNKGYSILSITDHRNFICHNDLSSNDFLMINGVEIDINKHDKYYVTYHLNFFAKNKDISKFIDFKPEYSVDNINKVIKDANENGFLVQYNHPRWSHQYAEDFVNLKGLWGFEIFNGGTEMEQLAGLGDFEYETFGRINQDDDSFPVASSDDDNHNYNGINGEALSDSFLGFNMIDSKSLSYEDVIEAMEKRQMYASMGPLIYKFIRNDNKLYIKTSNVKAIILLNEDRKRQTIRSNEDNITEANLEIMPNSKWFRIEIVDKEGKKAFTIIYKV